MEKIPGVSPKMERCYIPGSSKCVKFVPFHPKDLPKGKIFPYLEDPGMHIYILLYIPRTIAQCDAHGPSKQPKQCGTTGLRSNHLPHPSTMGISSFASCFSQVTPGQAKADLAQLEARLERLQCNGIDSVMSLVWLKKTREITGNPCVFVLVLVKLMFFFGNPSEIGWENMFLFVQMMFIMYNICMFDFQCLSTHGWRFVVKPHDFVGGRIAI